MDGWGFVYTRALIGQWLKLEGEKEENKRKRYKTRTWINVAIFSRVFLIIG